MKKNIKMSRTQKGSEDGIKVKEYNKGQVYMMNKSLADVFIQEKWAIDMETPENLKKENSQKVKSQIENLNETIENCLDVDLDSVQMQEKIDTLKAYPVTEDVFQNKFKMAEKIKAKGIKDTEAALKTLNASNAKKAK